MPERVLNSVIRLYHQFVVIPFTTHQTSKSVYLCMIVTNHYFLHGSLNCLKASSNADFIAGGFSDGFVKLWSVQSAKPDVPAPPPTNLIGHSGAIFGIDFSPDGDYLITGSEDKTGM